MSISLAISLAISWLRGSHTRRLDNESTRYIHGKLRLSTLFSKALLIEALVLITVCFKRRTPQGRMELHCLCIVSALSLHCLCIVAALSLHCAFKFLGRNPLFLYFLVRKMLQSCTFLDACQLQSIVLVFFAYTLYSYLFVQFVFHHTEFSAAPPNGGLLPPSPPVLRPFCSPGQ